MPKPSFGVQPSSPFGDQFKLKLSGEQKKKPDDEPGLQKKLSVGASNDPLEQEADRVADQVLAAPAGSSVCGAPLQIQRYTTQATDHEDAAAPNSVDRVLASSGQPLESALRRDMERRFGHDFSRVRVHSGEAAEQSAREVNAHAYTVGHNMVFAPGQFAPGTHDGRRLIAHELTHVVQQSGGGMPSVPAHERDADAASQALETGAKPQVRTRSRIGLAAQPKRKSAVSEFPEFEAPENVGLKIVTIPQIEARVARALKAPGLKVAEGRKDFNASPKMARANLYHSHFRDDAERLSYAVGVFRQFVGIAGEGVDENELFKALVNYEVDFQRKSVDIVTHTPPTRAENRRLSELRADRDRREYEAYLAEVASIEEEQNSRLLSHTGVYSGAATQGLYETYVGEPVKAVAKGFVEMDSKQMISLMINFVPIVGQLKAVAETIVGKDLITGQELPTWERGLNLLLAIIPEARGIFSAGRSGLRTLARVATGASRSAEEIYVTVKVASKLTTAEVQAAENLTAGAKATPAQLKLAEKLEELPGATTRSAAKAKAAAASGLEKLSEPVRLAGKAHALSIKRVGNQLRLWLCSNGCGELIVKLEAMLQKLPRKHAARAELEALLSEARAQAGWLDAVPATDAAQQELARMKKVLEEIEAKHPGVVEPDIHVNVGPPTQPTVNPDAPAGDFSALESEGALKPKRPRPRGTEEGPGKTAMAENFAKKELENSAWLRERMPDPEQRRRFMEYLQEGHFGEHSHLTPYTENADRILENWASGEPKVNLRPRR